MQNSDISLEIKKIFENNELEDLKRFMRKRQCLNKTNVCLLYLFHLLQTSGIFVTTIAAGYDTKFLIWIGVGLNLLATLINIYEKTNNNLIKKLMIDIKAIKEGKYVDESAQVDIEKNDKQNSSVDKNVEPEIDNNASNKTGSSNETTVINVPLMKDYQQI
jgi:hypothetical protein